MRSRIRSMRAPVTQSDPRVTHSLPTTLFLAVQKPWSAVWAVLCELRECRTGRLTRGRQCRSATTDPVTQR